MRDRLNEKLERLMAERGFSRKGLSRAAGLNETAVRDVLARGWDIKISTLQAFADALGVDISYFLSDVSDLSLFEAEIVKTVRELPEEDREWLRQTAERLKAAGPAAKADTDQPD